MPSKVGSPTLPRPPAHTQRLTRFFSLARAPSNPHCPSAVLRTIPPAQQPKVAQGVRAALTRALDGQVPASRAAGVKELIAHVGQPDFYNVLARLDPSHAKDWSEMAEVQRRFGLVEPKYDERTRAYSESMRLTLHAAVIQHYADPKTNGGTSLYHRFIELHPTAFHQNGAWVDNMQIPVEGAMAVAAATPAEMWTHSIGLVQGSFLTDKPTVAAAQMVRDARNAALATSWSPRT